MVPLPPGSMFVRQPAQDMIRDIYGQCDVWLFSSRSEGFGLPLLESMACRTPVIATPAGAAPELCAGGGGITVPLFKSLAKWETVKHADLTILGHYHQRYCLPNVMVNGSLIGYNAYAMGGGFPFEAPVQSLRMLDATRWQGVDIPLHVSERSDDDMARAA